jgi:hypothetical protein
VDRLSIADRLAMLAALLTAIAAAAGLLASDLYRDAPFWAQQARGTDVATLLLAVPLLVGGLLAARRGSDLGRMAALAGLLYLAYNYAIFSFSVDLNPLTPLYIAILGLTIWSLAVGVPAIDLPAGGDLIHGRGPVDALDLGLFLPGCIGAGVALIAGRPRAFGGLAIPLLLWLALTSAGIVGAFAFQRAAGDDVPVTVMVLVAAIGVVTAALPALVWLRSRGVGDSPGGQTA